MKKKNTVKKPCAAVHAYRCTPAEHKRIKELAMACGLSASRYVVESALQQHPRHRLTKDEVDALNSLAAARTDLIKISNLLARKTDAEKAKYFQSETLMRWWVDAVADLVQHWRKIQERALSSTLPNICKAP